MARLTGPKAIRDLAYIERAREAGTITPRLEEIAEHRRAFLKRSKCCARCGRTIESRESLKAWRLDGFGPECRSLLMQIAEAS